MNRLKTVCPLAIWMLVSLAACMQASAQQNSDIQQDTIELDQPEDSNFPEKVMNKIILKGQVRNPKKATILSAVLPGAGQIYNRQYYKVHVVYAALGGMIYAVDFNSRGFKRFDEAYRARLAGEPTPLFPAAIPDQSLLNQRNRFRKDRELSYFGLGFVYLLNIADAFVSAHLSTFNVDDDLITIRPDFTEVFELTGQPYPCLGLTFQF